MERLIPLKEFLEITGVKNQQRIIAGTRIVNILILSSPSPSIEKENYFSLTLRHKIMLKKSCLTLSSKSFGIIFGITFKNNPSVIPIKSNY